MSKTTAGAISAAFARAVDTSRAAAAAVTLRNMKVPRLSSCFRFISRGAAGRGGAPQSPRAIFHASMNEGKCQVNVAAAAAGAPASSDLLLGGRSSFLRSEEHTPELQSLMRNTYAVFCVKKKR